MSRKGGRKKRNEKNTLQFAGVGVICARTAVIGAFLNVKVNASGLNDKAFVKDILDKGAIIEAQTIAKEAELLALVNAKIS